MNLSTTSAVRQGLAYVHSGFRSDPAWYAGVFRDAIYTDLLWQQCEAFATPLSVPDKDRFNWTTTDAEYNRAKAAGLRVYAVFRCKHPWWCRPAPEVPVPPELALFSWFASAPPASKTAMEAFRRFVVAALTRYDFDGVQFESEPHDLSHFLGPVEALLAIHDVVIPEVRRLRPNALVILPGHTTRDLLTDDPNETTFRARVAAWPQPWSKLGFRSLDFAETLFRRATYDVGDVHCLASPDEVEPAVKWARARLKAGTPIWIGGATSAPLAQWDQLMVFPPDTPRAMELTKAKLRAGDPATWAARKMQQCSYIRAKYAAAKAAGAERIYWCTDVDYPEGSTLPYQGLVESNGVARPCIEVIRSLT